MTRTQLEELRAVAHFVGDANRAMFRNTSMETFQPPPGALFAERLARVLLERERAVKALKWESENGEGLSRKSVEVLAFVEEEA